MKSKEKTLSKIKLNELYTEELERREKEALQGGSEANEATTTTTSTTTSTTSTTSTTTTTTTSTTTTTKGLCVCVCIGESYPMDDYPVETESNEST